MPRYHSLQLAKGTYKLTFSSEGDAGQTIGVKIRKLPSSTLVYESTVNVNEPVTLFFTTESNWSEYKFLLTRKKSATITVKDIRIDASSEEEAIGLVKEQYRNEDIVLDYRDFVGNDFGIVKEDN